MEVVMKNGNFQRQACVYPPQLCLNSLFVRGDFVSHGSHDCSSGKDKSES